METQSLYFIEWKKCKGKVRIINLFKQFPKCYGEGTPHLLRQREKKKSHLEM